MLRYLIPRFLGTPYEASLQAGAISRVSPTGWIQETSNNLNRVSPTGWIQETTGEEITFSIVTRAISGGWYSNITPNYSHVTPFGWVSYILSSSSLEESYPYVLLPDTGLVSQGLNFLIPGQGLVYTNYPTNLVYYSYLRSIKIINQLKNFSNLERI